MLALRCRDGVTIGWRVGSRRIREHHGGMVRDSNVARVSSDSGCGVMFWGSRITIVRMDGVSCVEGFGLVLVLGAVTFSNGIRGG